MDPHCREISRYQNGDLHRIYFINSPLYFAIRNRHYESLKIFIELKVDLNKIYENGKTILDLLEESNNPDGQPYLLLENAGAKRSSELRAEKDDSESILNK